MEVNTNAFISKYIHTRMVAGITANTFSDMEAVVVGSDQVWRPRYFKRLWKSGNGCMKRCSTIQQVCLSLLSR